MGESDTRADYTARPSAEPRPAADVTPPGHGGGMHSAPNGAARPPHAAAPSAEPGGHGSGTPDAAGRHASGAHAGDQAAAGHGADSRENGYSGAQSPGPAPEPGAAQRTTAARGVGPEGGRHASASRDSADGGPAAEGDQTADGDTGVGGSRGAGAAGGERPVRGDAPAEPAVPAGKGPGRAPASGRGGHGAEGRSEAEAPHGPLPDGVRQRVIALAADGLGAMPPDEIPVPLRQFARFTPSRRAKLAATPLAGVLENDPVFRQRIAERLRRALPDLAAALESGRPPAAADPLDVAAAAYLLRPPGWVTLLDTAGQAAEKAAHDRAGAEQAAVVARLEAELAALRASTKSEHDKVRAELDEARKETEQLRRQVRGLQGAAKHAEKEAKQAKSELDAVRAEAQASVVAADKEARRLRGRVSEAESALEASRRAAREGRSMEDTRVRLLLDTVLEAAQGLRRELALPPVGIRPADTVDAVEPEASGTKDIAQRALEGDDPALLDQLLALPQAHLVIDGYNVTKTGYPSLALSEQRVRLLGGLAVIAAQTGCEITCVFDGAQLDAPVLLAPPRGVRVRFSKAGETADELIRRLVRAEPPGRPVVVVSSDREVADGVRRAGARPVPSTMLLRRLARG